MFANDAPTREDAPPPVHESHTTPTGLDFGTYDPPDSAPASGQTAHRDSLPEQERPLVFFSGGTALKQLSRHLARIRPHDGPASVHLVTTFDSGGSTARLRRAFAMPAIGDLRNRLMALADPAPANMALVRCLETRLPDSGEPDVLRAELAAMARADHPVWQELKPVQARCLQQCLQTFLKAMPADFDARQASLGNLCMTGKYLHEKRSLQGVMGFFSKLLHVHGEVLPIVEESLHLAARLRDGSLVVGQHHFKHLTAPVEELFLTVSEPDRAKAVTPVACRPRAASHALARLREASLVCYPMGSFFSSLMANLLADGVGSTLANLACPKVFMPNTGPDGELSGYDLCDELDVLLTTLASGAQGQQTRQTRTDPGQFVSHVLLDSRHGRYQGSLAALRKRCNLLGIRVVDQNVVVKDGQSHEPGAIVQALLAIARG